MHCDRSLLDLPIFTDHRASIPTNWAGPALIMHVLYDVKLPPFRNTSLLSLAFIIDLNPSTIMAFTTIGHKLDVISSHPTYRDNSNTMKWQKTHSPLSCVCVLISRLRVMALKCEPSRHALFGLSVVCLQNNVPRNYLATSLR